MTPAQSHLRSWARASGVADWDSKSVPALVRSLQDVGVLWRFVAVHPVHASTVLRHVVLDASKRTVTSAVEESTHALRSASTTLDGGVIR